MTHQPTAQKRRRRRRNEKWERSLNAQLRLIRKMFPIMERTLAGIVESMSKLCPPK